MTNKFDLKLANSLIPDFDGNVKHVEDFLDKCEFYDSQIEAAEKAKFLSFLLKVKILRNVKCKISTETTPKSFDDFKNLIINRFSCKTTKERKMNELHSLRQTRSLEDFATELEDVCAELIKLKMKDKEECERKTIKSEVEETAINVFTRGIKLVEIRQALIYKEPKTLSNAIQFALEAEAKLGPNETSINQYAVPNASNYNGQYKQPYRNRNFNAHNTRGFNSQFYQHNITSNPRQNHHSNYQTNANINRRYQGYQNYHNNYSINNNEANSNQNFRTVSKNYNTQTFYRQQAQPRNNNINNNNTTRYIERNPNRSNFHVVEIDEESGNGSRPQPEEQEDTQLGATSNHL